MPSLEDGQVQHEGQRCRWPANEDDWALGHGMQDGESIGTCVRCMEGVLVAGGHWLGCVHCVMVHPLILHVPLKPRLHLQRLNPSLMLLD